MLKLATFQGVSDEGEPLVRLFDPGISLVKQAGEMMPEIQKWLDSYTPEKGKIAVLVNALGASEYWGQNSNGDIFNEDALVHDCANHPSQQHPYDDFSGKIIPPYGAWTFMNAHPFMHHCNKDPNRAFGKVVLWSWNPYMHRVELVILIDKALALQHGAQSVVDRILAGEFPSVSMGCKVPFDVCTICKHKSKTRRDYCNCIRYFGMGKFLDDGRRVGVVNTYPRFFDISFVFVGADKTAMVMCKLGQEDSGLWIPQSVLDAEKLYGASEYDGDLVKAASVSEPDNLVKISQTNVSIGAGTAGVDLGAETLDAGPHIPKTSEPRIVGVPLTVSDRILSGRVDTQENLERRAMADGTVKTNADVNETDEFPEPLTPSHGKTAAVNIRRMLTHGLIGGGVGAGTGAYLGDGNRGQGAALGGATGAAAGVGLGAAGRWFGRQAGSRILGGEMSAVSGQAKKLIGARERIIQRTQEMLRQKGELLKPTTRTAGTSLLSQGERAQRLSKIDKELPGLQKKFQTINAKADEVTSKYQALYPVVSKQTRIVGGVGAGTAATVGGLGAGGLSGDISKTSSGLQKLWDDAAKMKIGPPPKPNRKDYPFTGSINFRGLMIHVENKPGSIREGKGWKTRMRIAYGEFLGTKGVDKDKLDVYVGPYRKAPNVYIIHQNFVRGPNRGKYDEDKVMAGFESLEQAKAAYLAHYNSAKYFRSATVMAFPLFKRAIMKREVHGEKVASEYANTMEKRAEELRLEDMFDITSNHSTRSKVWRHSDGRELKRSGSGMGDWGQVKQASKEKYASLEPHDLLKVSAEKWADIVKHIGPSKAVGKVSPLLSDSEPDLPKPALDAMSSCGMSSALTTPSLMGMVLKPKEFQRVCLNCMGKGGLADKMDDAGAVFTPNDQESAPCEDLDQSQLDPKLMEMLLPLMGEKSYFGPVVRKRIIRITIAKPEPMTPDTNVDSPLLSKVASAYTWYRREQMKLAADAMTVVPNIPSLHSGLYGQGDEDLFGKTAANVVDPKTLGVVLGAVPLTLMYSAHLRGRRRKGEDMNMLNELIADHPWLATAGTAAGLRELMKSPKARQAVDELMAAGKRIYKGAPATQHAL